MIPRLILFSFFLFSIVFGQTQIAVVEFQGKGVSNIEASALTDRLVLELFRTGEFTVLERELLEKILEEQKFQLTGCTSTECLIEIGRLANVQEIVSGSVSRVGNTYSISARLISVESGEILRIASHDQTGEIDALLTTGMRDIATQLRAVNPEDPIVPEIEVLPNTADVDENESSSVDQNKLVPESTLSQNDVNDFIIVGTLNTGFPTASSVTPFIIGGGIIYSLDDKFLLSLGFEVIEGVFTNVTGYPSGLRFGYWAPLASISYRITDKVNAGVSGYWGVDGVMEPNEENSSSLDESLREFGFSTNVSYRIRVADPRLVLQPMVRVLFINHEYANPTVWVGLNLGFNLTNILGG